jgi:hypothetical protein
LGAVVYVMFPVTALWSVFPQTGLGATTLLTNQHLTGTVTSLPAGGKASAVFNHVLNGVGMVLVPPTTGFTSDNKADKCSETPMESLGFNYTWCNLKLKEF